MADSTLADEGVAFERLKTVKKSNYMAFLRRKLLGGSSLLKGTRDTRPDSEWD